MIKMVRLEMMVHPVLHAKPLVVWPVGRREHITVQMTTPLCRQSFAVRHNRDAGVAGAAESGVAEGDAREGVLQVRRQRRRRVLRALRQEVQTVPGHYEGE